MNLTLISQNCTDLFQISGTLSTVRSVCSHYSLLVELCWTGLISHGSRNCLDPFQYRQICWSEWLVLASIPMWGIHRTIWPSHIGYYNTTPAISE